MDHVTFTGSNNTVKAFVGKAVAVQTKYGAIRCFGHIKKITPKGFMDVGFGDVVYRFDADGYHVSGGYVERSPDRIVTVESAHKAIKDKELAQTAADAINRVQVSSSTSHSLQAMLEQLDLLQNQLNEARMAVHARLNHEQ